jgi:hypothetical protein
MNLNIQLQITAKRDIKEGEVIDLIPGEIYMRTGYSGSGILVIEAIVYPKPEPIRETK